MSRSSTACPEAEAGTVDLALGKTSTAEEGWRMVPDPAGKAAVTHWRVATVRDGRAVVVFTPETGRTHQIRVHASDGIGIPIAGDPVYGAGRGPMLLHALSLRVEREGQAAGRGDRAAAADLRQCGLWRCRLSFPKTRWKNASWPRPGRAGRTSTRSRPPASCAATSSSSASRPTSMRG